MGDGPIEGGGTEREDEADESKMFWQAGGGHNSEPDRFALPAAEAEGFGITNTAGQFDGGGKIHSHFPGRMGIGTEGEGNMAFEGELQKLARGDKSPGNLCANRRC